LSAMPRRAGGLVIRPVQTQAHLAANRIMVQATIGSRKPLSLLVPLILHDGDGRFLADAEAIHKGRARLLMQPGPMIQML
jgi:tRNA1(Val) A37 N6-methylase TrmN6